MTGNKNAFGLDLASQPLQLATLRAARDSGDIVATGRILLVQDPTRRAAFVWCVRPIYRQNVAGARHSGHLRGAAAARQLPRRRRCGAEADA
ncbi:MAG: CHASE domain-containing protein [Massilia sp.]|nr:CHASE domain-containing protein [Massilia sp.]